MPQEYTPGGSSVAYTIPAYGDTIDAVAVFQAFATDVAAGLSALEADVAASARAGFTQSTAASYTLVLTDASKIAVEVNNASANTLTIPLNAAVAFPVGTEITIVQTGGGQVSIGATGGVTLNSAGGYLKIASQWSAVTLIKRATDTWVAIGALVA